MLSHANDKIIALQDDLLQAKTCIIDLAQFKHQTQLKAMPKPKVMLSKVEIALMGLDRANGLTASACMTKYNISNSTVRKYTNQFGVKAQTFGGLV